MAFRLEIGPGDTPNLDFDIHLDTRPLNHVEVVSTWQDAEFPEKSIGCVFSSQVLEHLTRNEQIQALTKTLKWLIPCGVVETWTPDLEAQIEWLNKGKISLNWFQHIIYGEHDYPDNIHKWVHTSTSIQAMFVALGYEIISCESIEGSIKLIARRPPED